MADLTPIVGCGFVDLTKPDFSWVFNFSGDISVRVECLWRLLDSKCIVCTSDDYGNRFGLGKPFDAAADITQRLKGATVVSVNVRVLTNDLTIGLSNGYSLEVIAISSGYEAWQMTGPGNRLIVAVASGNLVEFEA